MQTALDLALIVLVGLAVIGWLMLEATPFPTLKIARDPDSKKSALRWQLALCTAMIFAGLIGGVFYSISTPSWQSISIAALCLVSSAWMAFVAFHTLKAIRSKQ